MLDTSHVGCSQAADPEGLHDMRQQLLFCFVILVTPGTAPAHKECMVIKVHKACEANYWSASPMRCRLPGTWSDKVCYFALQVLLPRECTAEAYLAPQQYTVPLIAAATA